MKTTFLRVVKIGGSLLPMQNVVDRVDAWLDLQPNAKTLMVVGGGPTVDTIRELAHSYPYSDEFLHWLCVDLLDASFRLLQEQKSSWHFINSVGELGQDSLPSRRALVRIASFYTRELASKMPIRLPIGWETTTDSLAALLAHIVSADELVLLKSCDVLAKGDWTAMAELGVVDRAFPSAIRGIPCVRVANLRTDNSFNPQPAARKSK